MFIESLIDCTEMGLVFSLLILFLLIWVCFQGDDFGFWRWVSSNFVLSV